MVTFQSVGPGPVAYGQIGTDGSYHLRTGTDVGLAAGEYVVTVLATEPLEIPKDPKVAPTAPKPITPEKYNNSAESGLKFTIKPGANQIDLTLTSQ